MRNISIFEIWGFCGDEDLSGFRYCILKCLIPTFQRTYLKTETVRSSGKLVSLHITTQCQNPESHDLKVVDFANWSFHIWKCLISVAVRSDGFSATSNWWVGSSAWRTWEHSYDCPWGKHTVLVLEKLVLGVGLLYPNFFWKAWFILMYWFF
jgi:hypothetical protein